MAQDKKSFVGYCDWISQIDMLSDEESGKLFKHLLSYVNDENPEFASDERILKMAFEPIRLQLERDLLKYKEVRKKRSESGRQGGLKSAESKSKQNEASFANGLNVEQIEANQANANNCKQMLEDAKQIKANQAVTVNDTVNVNVTDNDILLEKETKGENQDFPFSQDFSENEKEEIDTKPPETTLSKKVAQKKVFRPPSVQEVKDYCNERKNGISAYSFVNFYQSKDWMIGKNKMKDWQAAVRTWELKEKENGKSGNNKNSGNGANNNRNNGDKVSGTAEIISGARYTEFT